VTGRSHGKLGRAATTDVGVSVVCVELAGVVGVAVVVRVTDRRQRAVERTLQTNVRPPLFVYNTTGATQTNVHRERARHLVDHPLADVVIPLPASTHASNAAQLNHSALRDLGQCSRILARGRHCYAGRAIRLALPRISSFILF